MTVTFTHPNDSTSNNCNIGTSDLPDMYARSLKACISGKLLVPITTTTCYTSGALKICPNLKPTAQLACIVTDADCDHEGYLMFYNVSHISMMYPIVVILIMGLYSH